MKTKILTDSQICISLPFPQFPADLVTFTEEILNGKLHFLYSGNYLPERTKFFSVDSSNLEQTCNKIYIDWQIALYVTMQL